MIILETIINILYNLVPTLFISWGMLFLFDTKKFFALILPTFFLIGSYLAYLIWLLSSSLFSTMPYYAVITTFVIFSLILLIISVGVAKILEIFIFKRLYNASIFLQLFFCVGSAALVVNILTIIFSENDLSIAIQFNNLYSEIWDLIVVISAILAFVIIILFKLQSFSVLAGVITFFGALSFPKFSAYPLLSYDLIFSALSSTMLANPLGYFKLIISSIIASSTNFSYYFVDASFVIIAIVFIWYFIRRSSETIMIQDSLKFSIKNNTYKKILLIASTLALIFLIRDPYYIIFIGFALSVAASGSLLLIRIEPTVFLGQGLFFGVSVLIMGTLLSSGVPVIIAIIPAIIITSLLGYILGIIWARIKPISSIWLSLLLTVFGGTLVQSIDTNAISLILARLPSYVSSLNYFYRAMWIIILFVVFAFIAFIYKKILISSNRYKTKRYFHLAIAFSGFTTSIFAIVILLTQNYSISAPFVYSMTMLIIFLAFFASVMRVYILLPVSIIAVALQGRGEITSLAIAILMIAFVVFLLNKEKHAK